ncbi:uncharacterized protein PG998_011601 [Apiospora kogelbergensis]|uniref:uncharacterized protein n=1 Tax=Apiospora kogelbergensis TaxID=1337665 RepID=UPI00312F3DE6
MYSNPYGHYPGYNHIERTYWQRSNLLQAPRGWDGQLGSNYYYYYAGGGNPAHGWPRQHLDGIGTQYIMYNPQTYGRSLEARGVPTYPSVDRGIW